MRMRATSNANFWRAAAAAAEARHAELPFVRIVKGQYGYFRTKETGDTRVRGTPPIGGRPGSPAFYQHYGELLEQREQVRSGSQARSTPAALPGSSIATWPRLSIARSPTAPSWIIPRRSTW
jgi:hypothetical protein